MRKFHPFRTNRTATTSPHRPGGRGPSGRRAGPGRRPRPLAEVHRQAKVLGVSPAVVDLLIDPTVPDVVRARALANVSAGIDRYSTGRARWAA